MLYLWIALAVVIALVVVKSTINAVTLVRSVGAPGKPGQRSTVDAAKTVHEAITAIQLGNVDNIQRALVAFEDADPHGICAEICDSITNSTAGVRLKDVHDATRLAIPGYKKTVDLVAAAREYNTADDTDQQGRAQAYATLIDASKSPDDVTMLAQLLGLAAALDNGRGRLEPAS